ncbi:MAG: heavy metal translocating P-type ATPase [Alphaproteobacteria bacterium]
MTCCNPSTAVEITAPAQDQFAAYIREAENGRMKLELLVPGIHCGGCISRIERALDRLDGVEQARVNFSTRRLSATFDPARTDAQGVAGAVTALGYDVTPYTASESGGQTTGRDATGRELVRALAVAGFAAGNVMLLSVSVWAGASDATRDLFHWLSALIALPAVAYAGRPFFRSALRALRVSTLNMDVPISLAVILAAAMSLYETIIGGEHTWFDASVTLLFFLLAGRVLDHTMRARAMSAVTHLAARNARAALVVGDGGELKWRPLREVSPGLLVQVAAGEQVPVDGRVETGSSELDTALLTGESLPESVAAGDTVHAGTTNLIGPLRIRVTAAGSDTVLAEIVRLMEAAEKGKAAYVRIADRAAQIYAPAIHILAGAAFFGWWWLGGDIHQATLVAIAVLIITCPCALGLAVPAVQIVASGLLFRRGVMIKDGAALERLAAVDTIVFDKTGTLTLGDLTLAGDTSPDPVMLALAAGLAHQSTHPLSRALTAAADAAHTVATPVGNIREVSGAGLEGTVGPGAAKETAQTIRLGRSDWAVNDNTNGVESEISPSGNPDGYTETVLSRDGEKLASFRFADRLRPDAVATARRLRDRGFKLAILSGDRDQPVAAVADALGIDDWRARCTPADKVAEIDRLRAAGHKVLVVGDGLNDGPALAAGDVSMAPAAASDLGRAAADLVFMGDNLAPVADALELGHRALAHIRQNFALAIAYNAIAVPVALAGLATPLIAAVAMSASSITVTANALRLRLSPASGKQDAAPPVDAWSRDSHEQADQLVPVE